MADVSMKKAVAWTAAAKYGKAAFQLLFAAILSRILTPEEYGTVAVINVFVVFFQLFCDMGFGTAVIQDKELSKKQINDIFSWTVYLGFFLQFLFIGVSFPIANFYKDSIYVPLGAILSVSLLFNALNMIPNAMMLREKRFKSITYRTLVASVVASLLTILLALRGYGVYALALQSLFVALIIFLWNELSSKLHFVFKPDIASIKRIWGYSFYQFLSQFLNYFNRNLDSLLIGKFFTKADLGQYNKSYQLMHLPIAYIPGIVGPALHPILSDHQKDHQYIYEANIKMLKILSLVGCYISIFLFFAAKELILILFGNQWVEAITPFRFLALSVWFQLTTNTVGPIYQSIGNTKLMFRSSIYSFMIIVSCIVAGCLCGSIKHVAAFVALGYCVNYFVTYFILTKFAFKQSFRKFLVNFWQEVVFFIILLGCAFIRLSINNLILSLLIKFLILTVIYGLLLFIFKQYKYFIPLLPQKIRNHIK